MTDRATEAIGMSVEVRRLRLFLAVAEELHFTRAAERLHLAQPALSAQIKKLEGELGLRLLERSTRSVVLTEDGEALLPYARTVVQAYDDTLAAAALLRKGGAGQLTLGINPRVNPQVKRRIMEQLAQINPRVTVDFIAEGSVRLVESVLSGHLSAAFCVAPKANAGYRSIVVRNDPFIVAMPADHPLAARESIELLDLKDEAWILPSPRVFGSNAIIQQHCTAAGFEMRVSAAHSDYDDDFAAVAAGSGIEAVPQSFTRENAHPGVAFVPLRDLTIPLHLIWMPASENRVLSCLIQAVLDAEGDADAAAVRAATRV